MSALAEVQTIAPRRVLCPRCATIVLEVPLREGVLTVLVERAEILPRQRCPECRSGRLRNPELYRRVGQERVDPSETYFTRDLPCQCGAMPGAPGWIGEEMRGFGAAVDEYGFARPVDLSRIRTEERPDGRIAVVDPAVEGEAIHRAHLCAGSVRPSA